MQESSDRLWLVHRGGYSACYPVGSSNDSGRCKIRVEQGGELLEVDEGDLEKVHSLETSTTYLFAYHFCLL